MWKYMKNVSLKKYPDYYKANEDISSLTKEEYEFLEDYVERFQYNIQKSKHKQLRKETLKTLLLKGIKYEFLELLNLMGIGDVF